MKNAKAIITVEFDERGQARAIVVFDPPLPPRPESAEEEEQWLESVPTTQLAGFVIMDEIMEMFGGEVEVGSVGVVSNDAKH